ncbi:MAG TPA: tripartite tricarboxylate transporter substrate binding protein [Burkholderiales bacterium]|nr:tripartite tricarboxylate transporter substrate binding protein [Burkholderiales bacterium]
MKKYAGITMLATLLVLPVAAWAQAYPSKPIRIIVPFAPGGGVDFIARLVGQKLGEALGQQIVVENRPGAGSAIGTEVAIRSAPDGYTLLEISPSYVINPSLRAPKFDPLNDYTPIVLIGKGPFVLVAHPSLPARNARELVALARSRPGDVLYGSSGQGTIVHLTTELFLHMAKVKMTAVQYKGGGPALIDVIAGHVQVVFSPPQTGLPHVKARRVRAIGMTSLKRIPTEPDIPALAETVPGYESTNWHAMIGPKGIPPAVVERVSSEVRKIVSQKDMEARLHGSGVFPAGGGSPDVVRELIRKDYEQWKKVIAQAGIKAE